MTRAGEEEKAEDEDEIDPRIREKLEKLNQCTEEINKLEKWFEQGNVSFRRCLSEYSDKLKTLAEQVGAKSVARARPYHEAKQRALAAQTECQRTVSAYEEACRLHVQARDEIKRTEERFHSAGPDFDVAWQELLNQAMVKLRVAEQMKDRSKEQHEASMKDFVSAEEEVQKLEKQIKRAILKSRPYFQESEKFKQHLIGIKQQIDLLTQKISSSKRCYAVTLKSLEGISDEIHERRSLRILKTVDSDVTATGDVSSSSSSDQHCPAAVHYDRLVPELDVTSARFQLQVRPAAQAFLTPETSCSSSSSSSCDPALADESAFPDLSQLYLNGFDEVELD